MTAKAKKSPNFTTPPERPQSAKEAEAAMRAALWKWRGEWAHALAEEKYSPPRPLGETLDLESIQPPDSALGHQFFASAAELLRLHAQSGQEPTWTNLARFVSTGEISKEVKSERLAQFKLEQKALGLSLARLGWVLAPKRQEESRTPAQMWDELAERSSRERDASSFVAWAAQFGAVKEALRIEGVAFAAASQPWAFFNVDRTWLADNPWTEYIRVPKKDDDGIALKPAQVEEREQLVRLKMAEENAAVFDELETAGALGQPADPSSKPSAAWLARMLCFLEPERAQRAIDAGASLGGLEANDKREVWLSCLRSALVVARAPRGPLLKEGKARIEKTFDACLRAGLGVVFWNHRGAAAACRGNPGAWSSNDDGNAMISYGDAAGPAKTRFFLEALAARGVDLGADLPSMLALGAASSGNWAPKARLELLSWAFSKMGKKPQWTRKRWSEIWRRDLLARDDTLRALIDLGGTIVPSGIEQALVAGPFQLAMNGNRRASTLELVLELGGDFSENNLHGATLAHWAAAREDHWAIESLAWVLSKRRGERQASLANLQTIQGESPIHLAAKAMSAESIKMLVKAGAEIHAKNKKGEGVIRYLSRRSGQEASARMPSTIAALDAVGADWREKDAKGRLAVAWMAKKAPVEILQQLARQRPELFEEQGASMTMGGRPVGKTAESVVSARGGEASARIERELIAHAGRAGAQKAPGQADGEKENAQPARPRKSRRI